MKRERMGRTRVPGRDNPERASADVSGKHFASIILVQIEVCNAHSNHGIAEGKRKDCGLQIAGAQADLRASRVPARGRTLTVPGQMRKEKTGNQGAERVKSGQFRAFRLESGHVTGTCVWML